MCLPLCLRQVQRLVQSLLSPKISFQKANPRASLWSFQDNKISLLCCTTQPAPFLVIPRGNLNSLFNHWPWFSFQQDLLKKRFLWFSGHHHHHHHLYLCSPITPDQISPNQFHLASHYHNLWVRFLSLRLTIAAAVWCQLWVLTPSLKVPLPKKAQSLQRQRLVVYLHHFLIDVQILSILT